MSTSRFLICTVLGLMLLLSLPDSGTAQLGKLKDKIKKEAEKNLPKPKEPEKPAAGADTASAGTVAGDSAATGKDGFQLYTKFDFVPGQRVLFYDDLSGEEFGEFPSRWSLMTGVFEIAKVGTEPWIMASTRGQISPKLNVNQLPERYTIEFEFLNRTSVFRGAHFIDLIWLDSSGYPVAEFKLFSNTSAYFYMVDDQGGRPEISNKQIPPSFAKGIHTIRAMVTKSSVKCYVDNERLVNAPKSSRFIPVQFAINVHGDDGDFAVEKFFVRNFRFAEGGKTMREQLDESGHVVTHGIYFDVNSDRIRGESYKTLADIAQMLADDPSLKLMIEGHTDSDGNDAANLDLSQRRAESVRQYLVDTYKVAAERLQSRGYGESKPIDANTTPEGKANNRRVELSRL